MLREIVERGALSIEEIPDQSQCVMGVGGRGNSKMGKLTIEERTRHS